MYSLFGKNDWRYLLKQEFLPFFASLIIAQTLFKWGSFTLELLAFAALWWVLGLMMSVVLPKT